MDSRDRSSPLELMTSARRGNAQALGELLESYRRYLKLLARLGIDDQVRGKIDASDVVQETFLQANRDFALFKGTTEKELMSWLRQILARTLTDGVHRFYRAKRRDVALERSLQEMDRSSAALSSLVAPEGSPSEHAVRREQAVLFADALDLMEHDQREVLVLRHMKGHTFAEIAQHLNRPESTVHNIWTRALSSLRRLVVDQL